MTAFAEVERRWRVRGKQANGNRLEFSVNAFDIHDAKRKAEAKKGGGQIDDVVLSEAPSGHRFI